MAFDPPQDSPNDPIRHFNPPSYSPHLAYVKYLNLTTTNDLFQGGESTVRVWADRDSLLITGPLAIRVGPALSQRVLFYDPENGIRPVRTHLQDYKSDAEGLTCMCVPRGLWKVAQYVLRREGVGVVLPNETASTWKSPEGLDEQIKAALDVIRERARGRFLSPRPVEDAVRIAIGTMIWKKCSCLILCTNRDQAELANRLVAERTDDTILARKRRPVALTPETWEIKQRRKKTSWSVCIVCEARSVATERMTRFLGNLNGLRLYGVEDIDDQRLNPFEEARLACFFGVERTLLWGEIDVISQKVKFPAAEAGSDGTPTKILREFVWTSKPRNAYVWQLAAYLCGRTDGRPRPLRKKIDELRNAYRDSNPRVLILAANKVHEEALADCGPNLQLQIAKLTDAKAIRWNEWDIFIRADASAGIPDGLKRIGDRKRTTIVDLRDESHPLLVDLAVRRRKEYRDWTRRIQKLDEDASIVNHLSRIRGGRE